MILRIVSADAGDQPHPRKTHRPPNILFCRLVDTHPTNSLRMVFLVKHEDGYAVFHGIAVLAGSSGVL